MTILKYEKITEMSKKLKHGQQYSQMYINIVIYSTNDYVYDKMIILE